jgi:HAD superfamily hydrolase (TIGR01509 family)
MRIADIETDDPHYGRCEEHALDRIVRKTVAFRPWTSLLSPEPIEAVCFDFHFTLVDQLTGAEWIQLAWRRAGRAGHHAESLGATAAARLAAHLDVLWDTAGEVDPASHRDLSPETHRQVFDQLLVGGPDVDPELAQALYDSITDTWIPYEQTRAVLQALHELGIRTALVSNIAIDVRPALMTHGLLEMFDHIVLSHETGTVKPGPEIFTRAIQLLGVRPERALMVGDNWRADAGAAQLGIRTLLLPRTLGFASSLSLVVSLVTSRYGERGHDDS